jgi:hypothetical protein
MSVTPSILLALLWLSAPQARAKDIIVNIPTSDALMVAQIIARNEGYDIRNTKRYYFEVLDCPAPLVEGYTSIDFLINGQGRSSISINNDTGQALDMNSCEIFDYPELRPFQEDIMRLTKVKRKTPRELADDVGCGRPRVLTKAIPPAKKK